MAEIKVLIEGYAKQIENGWLASSTVTLVKVNGKKYYSRSMMQQREVISGAKERKAGNREH